MKKYMLYSILPFLISVSFAASVGVNVTLINKKDKQVYYSYKVGDTEEKMGEFLGAKKTVNWRDTQLTTWGRNTCTEISLTVVQVDNTQCTMTIEPCVYWRSGPFVDEDIGIRPTNSNETACTLKATFYGLDTRKSWGGGPDIVTSHAIDFIVTVKE